VTSEAAKVKRCSIESAVYDLLFWEGHHFLLILNCLHSFKSSDESKSIRWGTSLTLRSWNGEHLGFQVGPRGL
jgi:hypothetical protein